MRSISVRSLRKVSFGALVSLVGGTYGLLVLGLMRLPLEYDEAFNMTVVKNLGSQFMYATNGAISMPPGPKFFDPFITTGPSLMVPSALLWFITGGSVVGVRIVPLAFFIAYLVGLWRIAPGGSSPWTKLMMVSAPLTLVVPTAFEHAAFVPTRLVGETAAACLLLWGVRLVVRGRWFVGGLLCGLAVQTKYVASIPLAAALFAVAVSFVIVGRPIRLKSFMNLASGVILPTLIFESIRLMVLGVKDYVDSLGVIVDYSASVVQVGDKENADAMTKMTSLGNMFETHSFLVIALVVSLALGLMLMGEARREAGIEGESADDAASNGLLTSAALLIAGAASLVFWLLFVQEPSGRHSLVGLLLMVPGLCLLAQRAALHTGKLRVGLTLLAFVGCGFIALNSAAKSWDLVRVDSLLEEQRQIADLLEDRGVSALDVDGWWQHPEFQVLTDLPIETPDRQSEMLIFDSIQGSYVFGLSDLSSFEETEVFRDKCKYTVFASKYYVICRPQ